MDAVPAPNPSNPNCTSTQYCAQGFSTNIFINLNNNSRLDAPGFSIFGEIDEEGMKVVDSLYSGYGEVSDLCQPPSTDPFCVGTGEANKGVSMERLLKEGTPYIDKDFPLLDRVITTTLHHRGIPLEYNDAKTPTKFEYD
jgi:hypothetical protein